jgi:hypothetical protein
MIPVLALPVHTYGFDPASFAFDGVTTRRAVLEHPHVTEREVVSGRVAGVETRKSLGDLGCGAKRQTAAGGEAQVPAKFVNVNVDWDEEPRRVEAPKAEVDAIGPPCHPPQEKEQPLAPRTAAGVGQKMRRAAPRPTRGQTSGDTNGVAPSSEGQPDGFVHRGIAGSAMTRELSGEASP